jgi:adenylate kinase family enzyme
MSSISDSKEFLDIKKMAGEIKTFYDQDTRQDSFNLLLCGDSGSGKTFLASTCRKPVHIDSFDPGGTKHLKPWIDKGEIIADTRFEGDDPFDPKVYKAWVEEMKKREKIKYFDYLGTYMLDSATSWSDAIMNQVLKAAGIPGEAPRFTHDYTPQKIQIVNWIKRMLRYPCDFILTGHLDASKDEVVGKVTYRFMTTGKGEVTIPLLFDELWVATTKETSKEVVYQILTRRTGPYMARTRIGMKVFETYEEPDIKKLLKKAGKDSEDKPLLT